MKSVASAQSKLVLFGKSSGDAEVLAVYRSKREGVCSDLPECSQRSDALANSRPISPQPMTPKLTN